MDEQATQAIEQKQDAPVMDILVAPDSRLKIVADRVKEPSVEDQKLIDEMIRTMKASDGIGLAATQVGFNKRIIVMDVEPLTAYEDSDPTTVKEGKFEMINPVIVSRAGKAKWAEGCLSVPGFKDVVTRDLVIEVSYLDRYGVQKDLKASGLLSACIQHEIDHLDGKLFVDHLSRLKRDIIVSKLKKFRKHGTMIVRPSAGLTL